MLELKSVLYKIRRVVLRLVTVLNYLNALVILALIIVLQGFRLPTHIDSALSVALEVSFIVFILDFSFRILVSNERLNELKANVFETVVVGVFILRSIFILILGLGSISHFLEQSRIMNAESAYTLFITLLGLLVVLIQLNKLTDFLPNSKINPNLLLLLSFVVLIFGGAGMLMLPTSSITGKPLDFVNALFLSTSASCVTGLTTLPIGDMLTVRGQLYLLTLIQLGGIGIVTFAAFFSTLSKQGFGIRQSSMFQNFLATSSLSQTKQLLQRIIALTFSIELIGAVLIYLTWGPEVHFVNVGQRIYYSVFHSVSAFCNAGFSLYNNGLMQYPVGKSYSLHIVIMGLIVFGGLGFMVFDDLFGIRALRERLRKPWKDWNLHTKVVINTSIALIAIGAILFYLLERNNTLKGERAMSTIIHSLFQSVTCRTAGFNTLDVSAFGGATITFIIMLMFIGASPVSTGGGIKTTTFFILLVSMFAAIRGRSSVEIYKRQISTELVLKSFAILAAAIIYNAVAVVILLALQPDLPIHQLVFEQISAFGTVGLSMGVTAGLNLGAKIVIIVSMFFGRVGLLTLAMSISYQSTPRGVQYPTGNIFVG